MCPSKQFTIGLTEKKLKDSTIGPYEIRAKGSVITKELFLGVNEKASISRKRIKKGQRINIQLIIGQA